MATKALNQHQHNMLHDYYPNNCCLCMAEERIRALKEELQCLKERVEDEKDDRCQDMEPVVRTCQWWANV